MKKASKISVNCGKNPSKRCEAQQGKVSVINEYSVKIIPLIETSLTFNSIAFRTINPTIDKGSKLTRRYISRPNKVLENTALAKKKGNTLNLRNTYKC